jgi:hypothetical protein
MTTQLDPTTDLTEPAGGPGIARSTCAVPDVAYLPVLDRSLTSSTHRPRRTDAPAIGKS